MPNFTEGWKRWNLAASCSLIWLLDPDKLFIFSNQQRTEMQHLFSQSSPLWGCRREQGTLWPLWGKAPSCCWAWWWPETLYHRHSRCHPAWACQTEEDQETPKKLPVENVDLIVLFSSTIPLTRKCRRHQWRRLSCHSTVHRTACPQESCQWRCKFCWRHQTGRLSQSQSAAKHESCN